MSTPIIPKADQVTKHVDEIAETHPLPWSVYEEEFDPEIVDTLNCQVSTTGIEAPVAAAVNAYADLPELLAERARLLVQVADLDGALYTARGAADQLRAGIARALGITEHDGDLDLIRRLTAAVHGLEGIDA